MTVPTDRSTRPPIPRMRGRILRRPLPVLLAAARGGVCLAWSATVALASSARLGDLGRRWGAGRAGQRLAALPPRSSALFPRAGDRRDRSSAHRDDRRLRSQLHGGIRQERASQPSSTLPELVVGLFGGADPVSPTSSTSWSPPRRPWLIAGGGAGSGGSAGRRPSASPSCSSCSTSGPISRSITWRSGWCPTSWRSRWAC